MPIAFIGIGSVTARAAVNNSISPTLPSGVVAGDGSFLVGVFYSRTAGGHRTSTTWVTATTMDVGPHLLSVYFTNSTAGLAAPVVETSVLTGQGTIGVVIGVSGARNADPFNADGANSNNASAQDIGPITAASAAQSEGMAICIGARNSTSMSGVSALNGGDLTWIETVSAEVSLGSGMNLVINHGIWTGGAPTLVDHTFDVSAGANGAGCGKMFLLNAEPAAAAEGLIFHAFDHRRRRYA